LKFRICGAFVSRALLVGALCIVTLSPLAALDFSISGSGNYSTEAANRLYADGAFLFSHSAGPFSMSWELDVDNKGTYPAPFLANFFGAFSFDIQKAGFTYQTGPFNFFLGKLPLQDDIESPYSLFLSGTSPSVMTGGFRYESGRFSFSDRWVGLDLNTQSGLYNTPSTTGIYADRGVVLKTYSYRIGYLRLGFQDATVFNTSYFDIDVFANPVPSFFVQYVLSAAGRPNSRSGNQNSVMGFFADYRGEGWSAYAQLLVDDFNMNRFISLIMPVEYQNPDKIAWSLGGKVKLRLGTLGIYTAGSTKYTFESVREEYYSYTLHPASAILSNGVTVAIPLEDQMLGYVYGENNVAFMAVWSAPVAGMDLQTGLEFVVSGSKSPANPWHNGENWASLGTQLLNDPVLEYKTLLNVRLSRRFGHFTAFAQATVGYIANRLNPKYPGDSGFAVIDNNYEPVFYPTAGDSSLVAEISLGGTWVLLR
jgi:hypothetical protein